MEKMLSPLRTVPGLTGSKRDDFEAFMKSNILLFSDSYPEELLGQIKRDLVTKQDFIRTLLLGKINTAAAQKLSFHVHDLGGTQRFESNLQSLLGISPDEEHKIWADTITAVANLNQRLANMAAFTAISHFEPNEAQFFFGKLHGLVGELAPSSDEDAFLRVISFTDLPTYIASKRIDIEAFLKVRETDECRLFRDWLSTTSFINDEKLQQLLTGLKAKAASFIASAPGKTIRFGVNAGLGLLPGYGTALSLCEGFVDTFLLDKLLPSTGVLTFLNKDMPSIFKAP